MGSQWTNKYNIMRDLSMVQGRVPADIDNTLTSGDKPPAVTLTEETEEEFFRNCSGDGDIAAPDLGLIRQMLDIVREIDESSDAEDVENLNNVIQISKLNPMTPDFVPRNHDHTSPKLKKAPEKTPHKKKSTKQNRNVALTSILELAGSIVEKGNEQKTLTNSVDVSSNVTASVKKVNVWLEAQQRHGTSDAEKNLCGDQLSKKKISSVKDKFVDSLKHTKLVQPPPKDAKDILSLDPSTMFRKKVSPKAAAVVECNKTTVKSTQGCEKYVPSSNADEYYKKYLERSKVHAMVHEDVWTRAERQMKEIDERRRHEAELFQQSYVAAQLAQSPQSVQSETSNQTYTISTEPATILNESPAMCRSPDVLSGSTTILSGSPDILHESPVISPAPSATKPVQGPWDLTTSEEQRLAVVILPYHRHVLTENCIVCKVRQKSQDDKVIYVIDADDRRLVKSKHKDDFDEIGGPTWRDDEHLKEWHYDDETNSWHKSNEEPKPREKKEKEPTHKNNGEVQLWRKNDGTIKKSEKSDMDNASNTTHDDVGHNNKLQLYRPENDITYIVGTMRSNELEYCSFESLESISQ